MYPAQDPATPATPVIAIVGGGASGTLAALYLLREATSRRIPLRIALIDRHGRHGLGQAYSTTHPAHLLNSPADTMSALADDPGHLTRWAAAAGLAHDGFLPRAAYGRYLTETLAAAERSAHPAARLTRLTTEVVAIRRCSQHLLYRHGPLRLHLAADGRIDADAVVLATGNLPPATPCPVPPDRYIADPWEPGELAAVADGRPVAVLGTGLSMLDVVVTLTGAHPGTVVHAISRHALLPREHRPAAVVSPMPVIGAADGPLRLTTLIRAVRATAAAHPDRWPDVVDALRPQIPGLWARLSPADQRLFLAHVARYWEVHRHRVPPATARRIAELSAARRLRIHRGRITAVRDQPGGLRLSVGGDTELGVGWLVNCTGPAADITATAHPLLRQLLEGGLVRPDALRLGLDTDPRGVLRDAHGRAEGDLVALGPLLRGSRYETTAIPEIRGQAAVLARHLLMSPGVAVLRNRQAQVPA